MEINDINPVAQGEPITRHYMEGLEMFSDAGVPPEEHENCLQWAFGSLMTEEMPLGMAAHLWNERHGDIFEVDIRKDKPKPFLWCVGRAYLETNFNISKEEGRLVLGSKKSPILVP